MKRTWIVVAHRAGARVIESIGPSAELQVVRDFENPEGKLKASEVNTDRPGQSISSTTAGPHPMVPPKRVTEEIADGFAKQIAAAIEEARLKHSFDKLVLVAAPRFLGRLREALSEPSRSLVVASLDKNIADAEPQAIRQQLETVHLV